MLGVIAPGRPAPRADRPAGSPPDPRGVGDRREPAASGRLLGPQRLGQPPGLFAVKRDGTLVREYAVNAPTSTGKTSPSTTKGISTWARSAITASGCRSGRSTGSTSPTRRRPVEAGAKLTSHAGFVLSLPPRGPVRCRGPVHRPRAGRSWWPRRSMSARPSCSRSRSIPLRPCSAPPCPSGSGSLPGFIEPATGADLSADGLRLAVLFVLESRASTGEQGATLERWSLLGTVRFEADGIEAIAWKGDDLILAGEGRGLFRIPAATWRARAVFP